MGEIKSTLDIIMEKTKKLTLSEEEKCRLLEKKLIRQGESLTRQYLNGEINLNKLLAELEKTKEENRFQVEKIIKLNLSNTISLTENNSRIFIALDAIGDNRDKILKIKKIVEKYSRLRETCFQRISNEIKAELAKKGISGSAVVPKVESNAAWLAALNQFKSDFRKKMEEIIPNF